MRAAPRRTPPCIFEYVYFARPDSMIDDISVHKARMRMGVTLGEKILRLRPDHDIDVVIPIPDTSRDSALEIANVLGVKYREGFIKNRYVGRTFIMPGQGERAKSVQPQAQPDPAGVPQPRGAAGRRFDRARHHLASRSCRWRATPARARSTWPRRRRRCATPTSTASTCRRREELVAHGRSEKEIEALLGCDWLIYQDLADLEEAVAGPKSPDRSSSIRSASTANT